MAFSQSFIRSRSYLLAASILMATSTASWAAANGPATDDDWQFGALIYAWLPNINGDLSFPNGSSQDLRVDAGDIISNLQFTLMGSFEARKGDWSGFTDVIYMKVEGDQANSVTVPTGASKTLLDTDLELKAWVWTVGGAYSLWRDDQSHLDLLAGARLLSLDMDLKLSGGGRLQRDRKLSASENVWTGIIGAKGRIALTDRWFLPYYADIGAGSSDLTTWQAFGGVGYAFDWGEVHLTYRHISYDQHDEVVENLSFGGPQLGVGLRF